MMPALLLSPITRFTFFLVVIGGLSLWAWGESLAREAAVTRARAAEAALESRVAAIAALETQAREAAARAQRTGAILANIRGVPNATACAASAPIRAALDGLRAAPSGGAAQPPRVPAAPPASSR